MLDPVREGRQALTDAIRAELVRDSTLGERAMTVPVLESLGLTEAQRGRTVSCRPGTIVIVLFHKGRRGRRAAPGRNTGYSVECVDAEAGIVRLLHLKNTPLTW